MLLSYSASSASIRHRVLLLKSNWTSIFFGHFLICSEESALEGDDRKEASNSGIGNEPESSAELIHAALASEGVDLIWVLDQSGTRFQVSGCNDPEGWLQIIVLLHSKSGLWENYDSKSKCLNLGLLLSSVSFTASLQLCWSISHVCRTKPWISWVQFSGEIRCVTMCFHFIFHMLCQPSWLC